MTSDVTDDPEAIFQLELIDAAYDTAVPLGCLDSN